MTGLGMVSLSLGGADYSGTATFAGVGPTADVLILGADLSGTIHIGLQDMEGTIAIASAIVGGSVLSGGVIQMDGDLSGDVNLERDLLGSVLVSGDLTPTGAISVLSGEVTPTGAISILGRHDGTIDIVVVSGSLSVGGDTGGTVQVGVVQGTLGVGSLSGSGVVQVTERLEGGVANVNNVGSGTSFIIADMTDDAAGLGSQVFVNTLGGTLGLSNGIAYNQVVQVAAPLAATGEIDLNWQGVAGTLILDGGSGAIVNGGTVADTGGIWLTEGNMFSGTATFVTVDGFIRTEPGDVDGTINITGDVNGSVGSDPGDLLPGGVITVGGDVNGWIYATQLPLTEIGGDLAGEIDVAGNVAGLIGAVGNISGSVDIGGNVDGEILAHWQGYGSVGDITADVTVLGTFDGNICGNNLGPGEALPPNINLTFGPNGTVCGAPPCFVPVSPPAPDPNWVDAGFGTKNRYISFEPDNPGLQTALRVTLANSNPAVQWWVGPPFQVCENSGQDENNYPACAQQTGGLPLWFWAAELKCDPFFRVWAGSCSGGFCTGGLNDGASCTDDDDCAQSSTFSVSGKAPNRPCNGSFLIGPTTFRRSTKTATSVRSPTFPLHWRLGQANGEMYAARDPAVRARASQTVTRTWPTTSWACSTSLRTSTSFRSRAGM